MKVIDIIKAPIVKEKTYPLFKIADIVKEQKSRLDSKEDSAMQGLIASSNIFASEDDLQSKKDALIRFSEYLETFADSDESLYQIQNALSQITGVEII